jgi:hypothetical protein
MDTHTHTHAHAHTRTHTHTHAHKHTHTPGLEVLRAFPSVGSPHAVWTDLAPVSSLQALKELQLVGYAPTHFTAGAATGAWC